MVNEEQYRLWNGPAGAAWVEAQASLDRLFLPFQELLVDTLAPEAARVLDVGCGTGATTLAVARHGARDSRALGVDVSAPMIALARERAGRERSGAQFLAADAQEHDFVPAQFDAVISRFGVMFFDDPARAFTKLRHATRAGGQLHCIAFRAAAENPFMTTAERAAAHLLPDLPPRVHDAPGQFAFADDARVRRILEQGGWRSIDIRPIDVTCVMPESELIGYLTRLGPVGLALKHAGEAARDEVIRTVRAAFDPYVWAGRVQFVAACWSIRAQA